MLLFVFVALRPMSTAMVIAGRSVYLTTLFPGQFVCLFDFILYVHSTIFQLCGTVLPGLNQY